MAQDRNRLAAESAAQEAARELETRTGAKVIVTSLVQDSLTKSLQHPT
jgi:hypothetical protein